MRVILTAGGTGGHIYPALGVIEELKKDENNQFLYIGTKDRMESELVPSKGIDYESLEVYGLTRNIKNNIKNVKCIISSYRKAKKIISDYENSYLKYMLPWGDMILLDEKETTSEMILKDRKDIEFSAYGVKVTNIEDKVLELSEIKKSLIYVSSSKLHTSVIRHNEVIKSEDSPRLYKLNKITLRTCVERSITNYYVNGDYVVKETFFVPSVLGSGVYKSELEGKSFYKVYRVVDDKVYEEYNTVKEGVQGYQLLDSSELRLILGRGVK